MSGISFPLLVAGAKARASDVEKKFAWVVGDYHPFDSTGSKATRTYDLGSSSWYWRNLYFSSQTKVWSTGSPTIPSYAGWHSTTGWYEDGVGDICFTRAENLVMKIGASTTTFYGNKILLEDTSTAQPALAFEVDPSAGLGYNKGVANYPVTIMNSGASIVNAFNNGVVTRPLSPHFAVFWNTISSYSTSTFITLTSSWTEVTDVSSCFSTGVFLALTPGVYLFAGNVPIYGNTGRKLSEVDLVTSGSKRYKTEKFDTNTSNQLITPLPFSMAIPLAANERVWLEAFVDTGGSFGLFGTNTANEQYSWFTGVQIA